MTQNYDLKRFAKWRIIGCLVKERSDMKAAKCVNIP